MIGDMINRLFKLHSKQAPAKVPREERPAVESSRFYKTLARRLWDHATVAERERLGHVYSKLFSIRQDLQEEVRLAQVIEILTSYDHKSWPNHYQLQGVVEKLQETVTRHYEGQAIDQVQRNNYFILARGGQERHEDVAYGLSGKLKWVNREEVVDALMAMGRREYHEPIPSCHENENGVLHIAVSYKHSSRFDKGGTLTWKQANAIWAAVSDMPLMTDETEVRVWLDQNLHRKKFPPGTEWHEYGLLPYACLQTVYIGTGDFSLKHAYTRPWLWVEMITGLKASGIRTRRGHDVLRDCNSVLIKRGQFERQKQRFIDYGCVFGVSWSVDRVMDDITRTISLWRRDGFMGHAAYEYADDFEKFVNWARRFVIRGKPYSEMSWNHGSEDVKGMDAVVLIRALPSVAARPDAEHSVVIPNISWRRSNHHGTWMVGDVIDRSAIGELPLSAIIETNEFISGMCNNIIIEDQRLDYGGVQLRRTGGAVSLVLDDSDTSARQPVKFGRVYNKLRDSSETSSFVTLAIPQSFGTLLTYQAFTQRYATLNGYTRIPARNEVLNPLQANARIWQQLDLHAIGVAYNLGVCEQVYTVTIDDQEWPVSALEVYLIMGACNGKVDKFKSILRALKENCSYKEIGFRDLNDSDKIRLTRGWPVKGLKHLNNKRIASGEMKLDIEEEVIEALREEHEGHAIVWIDAFDSNRVQFTFRRKHFIVRCLTPRMSAERAIAVVEGERWKEFVNAAYAGPLQMVAGVQPRSKVQAFGAGLNPLLKTNSDFDSRQLNISMMPGLFASCVKCGKEVCPVNGLTADVHIVDGLYNIRWQQPHSCFNPEYTTFQVDKRTRIA